MATFSKLSRQNPLYCFFQFYILKQAVELKILLLAYNIVEVGETCVCYYNLHAH